MRKGARSKLISPLLAAVLLWCYAGSPTRRRLRMFRVKLIRSDRPPVTLFCVLTTWRFRT